MAGRVLPCAQCPLQWGRGDWGWIFLGVVLMRSTRSNDFLGLLVATGFLLNLFLAGNILVWTGHRTASWATLGAGFGVYSLIQLYYALRVEEKGSQAKGMRVIGCVMTGGAVVAYAAAIVSGWEFAGSIGLGLAFGGVAAGVASSVQSRRERRDRGE